MKCPNCNNTHKPLTPFYQIKYQIKSEELNDKEILSVCLSCGTVLRCTTYKRLFYFIAGFTLIGLVLFLFLTLLIDYVIPDSNTVTDAAGTFVLISFVLLYFYGYFSWSSYFMKYESLPDTKVNLTINSVQPTGWKVLGTYVLAAILGTTLLLYTIDFTSIGEIWLPILFVVYIGVLLYLAGLILLRYTVREKLSGTKFELNK